MSEHEASNEFWTIKRILEGIGDTLNEILDLLRASKIPTGVSILQEGSMAITGIQAGAATPNVFESDAIPTTTSFPAGTIDTWTASDPLVVLTPSATNPIQVAVSTPATNTNTTFNLTVSTQMPPTTPGGTPPAPLTATVAVPILAAPAPVPTGVTVNQIS